MTSDVEKIPGWLKSLWNMENELRNAARSGAILQKDATLTHLAEARRHLEEAMKSVTAGAGSGGEHSAVPAAPPVRKDVDTLPVRLQLSKNFMARRHGP